MDTSAQEISGGASLVDDAHAFAMPRKMPSIHTAEHVDVQLTSPFGFRIRGTKVNAI